MSVLRNNLLSGNGCLFRNLFFSSGVMLILSLFFVVFNEMEEMVESCW